MNTQVNSSTRGVGLVVGVFDLFHIGHLRLLGRARDHVDKLCVVVNGDKLTASYKRRPVINENDRAEIVKSCRYVDAVEISNEYDVRPYLTKFSATKLFHGSDWERTSYLVQVRLTEEFLLQRKIEMIFLPYTNGVSTSALLRTLGSGSDLPSAIVGRE